MNGLQAMNENADRAAAWIPIREVARRLAISERWTHQLCERGELVKVYRIGHANAVGVTRQSFDKFLEK
jgi:hypothetical protein